MNILDYYVKQAPGHQHALDLFKDQWTSVLPTEYRDLVAGKISLFQDHRISWADSIIGGFKDKSVVELGPLEAGHTYMLEKTFGAASILGIESNSKAFLKCLIVKEILELVKSRFLLGDCFEYFRDNTKHFDVCLASGILYHMVFPVTLLEKVSLASDCLVLWTHYYDEQIIKENRGVRKKFSSREARNFNGYPYSVMKFNYQGALKWAGFRGGSRKYSFWMHKEDILHILHQLGYQKMIIGSDDLNHPNGPCILLAAFK